MSDSFFLNNNIEKKIFQKNFVTVKVICGRKLLFEKCNEEKFNKECFWIKKKYFWREKLFFHFLKNTILKRFRVWKKGLNNYSVGIHSCFSILTFYFISSIIFFKIVFSFKLAYYFNKWSSSQFFTTLSPEGSFSWPLPLEDYKNYN